MRQNALVLQTINKPDLVASDTSQVVFFQSSILLLCNQFDRRCTLRKKLVLDALQGTFQVQITLLSLEN